MKNPWMLCWPLAAAIGWSACGRRETADPADPLLATPAAFAEETSWPEGLAVPADLPPCPGRMSVEDATGDERNGSIRLLSRQRTSALAGFYTETLSANGWVMASSFRQGQDEHLHFRLGPRFLRLQIGPASGREAQSQVRLAWALPEGVPLAIESQAPDYEEEMSEAEPPSHEW